MHVSHSFAPLLLKFTSVGRLLIVTEKVYALASVLAWFIITVCLLDSAYPVWYPYYGSWLVAFTMEVVLVTLSVIYRRPTTRLQFVRLGLTAFRISLIVSLLLLWFCERCAGRQYSQADEENQPLLSNSHVQGFSEDSGTTQGSAQYGSITTSGNGAESTDLEAKYKERERKAHKRVTDRLREDGNWWTYAKGFSVGLCRLALDSVVTKRRGRCSSPSCGRVKTTYSSCAC